MYQIVDKSKIILIDDTERILDVDKIKNRDNNTIQDLPDISDLSDLSDFSASSSFDVTKEVNFIQSIYGNNFLQNQYIEELKYIFMMIMYNFNILLMDIQNKRKAKRKFYNIKDLVTKYNQSMNNINDIYNEYIRQFNTYLRFNMTETKYMPLILENYNLPINNKLIEFINLLNNNVTTLYREIMSIPNLIPKFNSIKEVNEQIKSEIDKEINKRRNI